MSLFSGGATALITPFTESGIDYVALERLIEKQIAGGIKALIVCGTTGEPSTMTRLERLSVIDFVTKKVAKRVHVSAGTGGNNTQEVIDFSKEVSAMPVDSLLIVTPYYNKCTQKGLIEHYASIAREVKLPIILYNVPSRTGVNILPATAVTLSAIPNIVAIKEASGNIDQIMELMKLTRGKLDVYSGDDSLAMLIMALGGKGVISVCANAIPDKVSALMTACLNDNYKLARDLQLGLLDFFKACFVEVNPIPIKTALSLMGMCKEIFRAPLCSMEDSNRAKLIDAMRDINLL